jgi:hypothetical protein
MMQVAQGTALLLAKLVDEQKKARENLNFKDVYGITKDRFERSCISVVLASHSYSSSAQEYEGK